MNSRNILRFSAAAGSAKTVFSGMSVAAPKDLTCIHFPSGEKGFYRAPVLVCGGCEAVLIDCGFTFREGRALAMGIKSTGRVLTTIYVSHSTPDFYFGLRPLVEAFPQARVIAASETVAEINASVEKQIEIWGAQLGKDGPRSVADVVIPTADDRKALTVNGHLIAIEPAEGLVNHRYLWVEDLKAVIGGALVFSGTHVWTADMPTKEQRAAWVANLDAIIARKPQVVVPGYISRDAPVGIEAVHFTKDYLLALEELLKEIRNSKKLIAAMKDLFPDLEMDIALNIGVRVLAGEMKWN